MYNLFNAFILVNFVILRLFYKQKKLCFKYAVVKYKADAKYFCFKMILSVEKNQQ